MKFEQMEDGKEYTIKMNDFTYRKRNQLLRYLKPTDINWRYSELLIEDIATMDFTEVTEYHTFEEAIEHMKVGFHAKFYFADNDMDYSIDFLDRRTDRYKVLMSPWSKTEATFYECMLEPKWQLL